MARNTLIQFAAVVPKAPIFSRRAQNNRYHVSVCNQTIDTSVFLLSGSGYVKIESCSSVNGFLEGNPHLVINSCDFQRSDYLTAGSENFGHLQITPMPITTQTGRSYAIISADGGTKIQFDCPTA